MPGSFDTLIGALAPHLRSIGMGILVFVAICIFVSGLGFPKLNKLLGGCVISCALLFALTIFGVYFSGHAKAIAGNYSEHGSLILYGIVWPLVVIWAGLEVAFRDTATAPKPGSIKDNESS